MPFVADDLGAWLVGVLADAGRRKLTELVLGTDQERALRSAATAAVRLTAGELHPGDDEQAEHMALVISQVFKTPVPGLPFAGRETVLEALQARMVGQLAVLDDASLTGTGQSSAALLGVPGAVLAEKLTGHLLQEVVVRGSGGGPLFPLSSQLNDDLTHLQVRRLEGAVDRRADELLDAMAGLGGTRAAAPVPTALAQLPPEMTGFIGRDDDLEVLGGLLDPARSAGQVMATAIAGLAGVGKTALAVHTAHAAVEAGWFPGGVLFIDLHGYDDNPTQGYQALDSLLRALGVPGRHIPPEPDARAGLYRSQLAKSESPMLVIADNASTAGQVLPLLPGDPRHRVLVTSRHTLRLNARLYDLNLLTPHAAVDLLEMAVRTADPSDTRIAADTELATRVAESCGRLPLALQIAAALLVADPGKTLGDLAGELSEESHRLIHLDDGERAVRIAFELSYRCLPAEQACLFRRLALNPGPDLAIAAAVVLAEKPLYQVRRMLAELLRAHMVQRAPVSSRWTMHDLLRDYARSLVTNDPENERQRQTGRLLDYYLHSARAANRRLGSRRDAPQPELVQALPEDSAAAILPAFADRKEALAWLEAERANLQSCVVHSAAASDAVHATGIAHATAGFLRSAGYWRQAVTVHRVAVTAANAAHDLPGQAIALTDLGAAQQLTGDLSDAVDSLTQALQLYRDLKDQPGQVLALTELGAAQRLTGQYPAAIGTLRRAIELHQALDDPQGRATALSNLGAAQRLTGDLRGALTSLTQALQLYSDLHDQPGQARVLNTLGAVQREAGDYPAATDSLTNALRLHRELDDRSGEASALNNLGAVQWLTGDLPSAVGSLSRAFQLHQDPENLLGQAHVLTFLGAVQRQKREFAPAKESLSRALMIYRELGDRGGEVEALNHYAELHTITGNQSQARALHLNALALARDIRSRWDEANTLRGLAATYRTSGNFTDAEANLSQAIELYSSMGCAADVAAVQAELNSLRRNSAG